MAVVVVLFVLVMILIRFGLGSSDKTRIASDVEGKGGRVVSISWAPFGHGWFGEKNDRIYEVVYYDADGRQHFATAKTNMISGVFWHEDAVTHERPGWYGRVPSVNEPGDPLVRRIGEASTHEEPTGGAPDAAEVERLRAENERLREELRRRSG